MIFSDEQRDCANHQRRPNDGSLALSLNYLRQSNLAGDSNIVPATTRPKILRSRKTTSKLSIQRTKIAGGSPFWIRRAWIETLRGIRLNAEVKNFCKKVQLVIGGSSEEKVLEGVAIVLVYWSWGINLWQLSKECLYAKRNNTTGSD